MRRSALLRDRAVDIDRRGAQFSAVPVDRTRDRAAAVRTGCDLARALRHSDRARRTIGRRVAAAIMARVARKVVGDWSGVRGGISVALALSLPETPYRVATLMATHAVVLFSILVRGSTLPAVVRLTLRKPAAQQGK